MVRREEGLVLAIQTQGPIPRLSHFARAKKFHRVVARDLFASHVVAAMTLSPLFHDLRSVV
jgi:hypothetical protein